MATVSDESCGGAEQMLFVLEREVARRSYHTTVAACEGSIVTGRLLATGAPALCFEQFSEREAEHDSKVLELIAAQEEYGRNFDVVHDEGGGFWANAHKVRAPVLVTLNLPRVFYPRELFENVPANVFFNCVSNSQLESFTDLPQMLGAIPNGVAVDLFPLTPRKSNYLVWLGRICEEKGAHIAIEVAERAGMPLVVIGPNYLYARDKEYFDAEIEPRLKGTVSFVGSPSFSQKVELLRHARGMLMPSLLDETSSLVCIESMACGTPPIAFRRGALPEVVRDGYTGFIVDSAEEMTDAVRRLSEISPAACRKHVEAKHSAVAMADHYERIYEALAIHPVVFQSPAPSLWSSLHHRETVAIDYDL